MNEELKAPLSLDVTLYGALEQVDDSKSKCRVRIFYKGLNRNRTYISDDFANQLIASLPYAPVKGIFNSDDVDFEGHGDKNRDGQIYGLVMAEPNFAWEEHTDNDGVTRTYACADVLLYTSLYNEAKTIPGCSQSMEINPYTYSGEWRTGEDGRPFFYFMKGSLFGLQVLGAQVEPCFEGSSFYNLATYEKIKQDFAPFMDYIKQFSKKKEEKKMENVLFRLSDNEKAHKIFSALNPNFNEAGNWVIDYFLLEVYDDYAVAENKEGYQRIYYTKNDDDTITLGEFIACKITDVTETEMSALEAMKAAHGSYEAYVNATNEVNSKVETLTSENETLNSELTAAKTAAEEAETANAEKITGFETQIAEFETKISEFETAATEAETKYAELEAEKIRVENEKNDLISEKEELVSFKTAVETEKKEEILFKYTEYLTDEMVENFRASMQDYSIEDFKKEVCTAAVENDATVFSRNDSNDRFFKGGQIDETKGVSGVERILNKYKNGGNK